MPLVDRRGGLSPSKADSPLKRSIAGTVGARVPMSGIRTPSSSSVARLTEAGVPSEPIQAFLRIRPASIDEEDANETQPYIQVVSDTDVILTPLPESTSSKSMSRLRSAASAGPTKYTFSQVFPPEAGMETGEPGAQRATAQSQFFQVTTLPLVQDLLEGKNSLVFTYGVTNSGKTYTVQGSPRRGESGILLRTIDVLFNSIDGYECTRAVRPMGLTGVQPGISDSSKSLLASRTRPRPRLRPGQTREAGDVSRSDIISEPYDIDPTKLDIDKDYRYSIWVSYVEVYNEKLYDLFEMPMSSLLTRMDTRREYGTSEADAKQAPTRRPLLLKSEVESGGKYVGGLKEIKVSSIQEARDLIRCGQENRSVFSTMANRSSSRSHSVFTIKVLREYTGVDLPGHDVAGLSRKYFVSRLSIVDLAGSERIANTDISAGPRLKEAGSINKSLMCLGQCLETMRKNQIRAGISTGSDHKASLSQSQSSEPRRRRQSIVPFRHSKLTELFQSFFLGDGKVVMIVNVNPYGTGYEENAHVMRFSAMAKDVGIQVTSNAVPRSVSSASLSQLDDGVDDSDDESVEETEQDEFVNMLLAENERLRQRCERAESLLQVMEKSVRDEMAQYTEAALKKMQLYYEKQLQAEVRTYLLTY
ncbi:microtubule motor protein [Malassezia pachydermatis]